MEDENNIETLEIPKINMDFYLGSEYGSGIKAKSLKEFLEYIVAEVVQANYDGKTTFDLTIEEV